MQKYFTLFGHSVKDKGIRDIGRIILLFSVFTISCREPFTPQIDPQDLRVLVVEGYLDTDGLPSILNLSYTRALSHEGGMDMKYPEAEVFLVSDSGQEYPLKSLGKGEFEFAYDIEEENHYTLHILAKDGKSYFSEKLYPIPTPEIDELGFERTDEGVEIYVGTKGNEKAGFFMWNYEETYSFRSAIPTYFKYEHESKDIVYLEESERTDICYIYGDNEELLFESSDWYEEGKVFRKSLNLIPNGDERLSMRYSILVSQRALSDDAANFWRILNKNSTELGTIFSPLPSQMPSNIRQEGNPEAAVIGYVSLGKIRQQRLFITILEVTPWPLAPNPAYYLCELGNDTIPISAYEEVFGSGEFVPATPIAIPGVPYIVGYRGAERRCADCTLRGTNVRPEFW